MRYYSFYAIRTIECSLKNIHLSYFAESQTAVDFAIYMRCDHVRLDIRAVARSHV